MNWLCDENPIVSAFVWALAAWTILVHIAVATGGSFNRLLEFSPIALLVAALGWLACSRSHSDPIRDEASAPPYSMPWLCTAALVLASYCFGYTAFWSIALTFTLAAWTWNGLAEYRAKRGTLLLIPSAIRGTLLLIPPGANKQECPPYSRRANAIGLAVLCAAGIFITLLLHQSDIDDSFYISAAADAHRHPDRAIWSTDTVHDDPRLPVFLPIYKAESYEYLIALAAKLLRISSIRAAHTALPVAFSIFVVLAWAMLARTIDSKNWFAIALVTIIISLLAGAAKQGPANYTFTRLQQGKSVMVSAIVPILCVYAWRFATLSGWRNALLLVVTQIAAVGLSSTAIVIGPAVIGAVGFFCFPFNERLKQILQRLTLIAATCIYPLSIALLMRGKMLGITWLANTPAHRASEVVTSILGDRAQLWFFFAAVVGAWTVAPRRSRTLLLAPSVLLLGVMTNPLLTHFLQTHVFTPNTYWRGLWVMPWLVWSSTFVCGLSVLVGSIAGFEIRWLSRVIAVGFGALVLLVLLGRHPIWRQHNGTYVGFGGLAVDQPEYAVAQKLAAETPPGTAALAPEVVACWTAALDDRPKLIFVRSFYTQSTGESGGMEDVQMRNRLGEIAGKTKLNPGEITTLLAGADRYRLGSIVLGANAGNDAADALAKAGFRIEAIGGYSLWIRHRF